MTDRQLLDLRLCDLPVQILGTQLEQRIEKLYVQAFGRLPDVNEMTAALRFIRDHNTKTSAKSDLNAWADLCHVLFNAKEFIFIN